MRTKTAGLLVMVLGAALVASAASPEDGAIRKVLADYQAAMEARSVEKLAAVVTDDLLILEGTHKNDGWADYRDKHIGPEMAEWKEFKVAGPVISRLEAGGALAYAVQEATFTIIAAEGPVVMLGAETFVLGKTGDRWKIKHVHMSSKRLAAVKPAATQDERKKP